MGTPDIVFTLLKDYGESITFEGVTYYYKPGQSGAYSVKGERPFFMGGNLITEDRLREVVKDYVIWLAQNHQHTILDSYYKKYHRIKEATQ